MYDGIVVNESKIPIVCKFLQRPDIALALLILFSKV